MIRTPLRKKSYLKRKTPLLRSKVFWRKDNRLSRNRLKYGNKSCKCILKHQHDSIWESEVCDYLYSLAKDKRIKGYITQKSIDLIVRDQTICAHIIDFYVITNDDRKLFVETKGFSSPVWAIKRKLTQALYEIPYITIYRGQLDKIDKELKTYNTLTIKED